MGRLRYLVGNLTLLNFILAGAFFFFVVFLVLPLFSMKVGYSLPGVKKPAADAGGASKKPAEAKNPFPSDYTVIAEQNLFHPERKIPELKAKTEAPPLPKPEFVLTGTLIMDNLKLAYLMDKKAPVSTPGRQNRQTTMKMGDAMSGFVLKEIHEDKVLMQRGEEKIVVLLTDASKARAYPVASAEVPPAAQMPPGKTDSSAAIANQMPARQVPFVPTETGTRARSAAGTASAPSTGSMPSSAQRGGFFNLLRRR